MPRRSTQAVSGVRLRGDGDPDAQAVARVLGQPGAELAALVDVVDVVGDRPLELLGHRHHPAIAQARLVLLDGGVAGEAVPDRADHPHQPAPAFRAGLFADPLVAGRAQGLVDRLDVEHLRIVVTHVFRRQHHLGLRILRRRGRRQDGGGRQAKQAHAELRHGRQSIGPPAAAAESPLSLRVRAARGRYNERPHGPDAMSLHLYNTLTRRVEPFAPLDPACPTMYVCGPTVYNYVHIGNARGPVVFGVLAALLRRRFGGLRYARNITDVDDKINAAAKQL